MMRIQDSDDEDAYEDIVELRYPEDDTGAEVKNWNIFRDPPPEVDHRDAEGGKLLRNAVRVIKVILCIFVFCIVLGTGVIAKGTILFMTSQLSKDTRFVACNDTCLHFCNGDGNILNDKKYIAELPEESRVAFVWVLFFCLLAPEVGSLLRSLRMVVFKSWRRPRKRDMAIVMFTETCHIIGVAIFAFSVLPDLDVIKAAMITNCVCFVPGIFWLINEVTRRRKENETRWWRRFRISIGILALISQASGFIVWPLVEPEKPQLWAIPAATILTSFGWWENYVKENSSSGPMKFLAQVKKRMKKSRYYVYTFVSFWKCICLFSSMLIIWHIRAESVPNLFNKFASAFSEHQVTAMEVPPLWIPEFGTTPKLDVLLVNAEFETPLWLLLIQIVAAYTCYVTGKYACRIMIQQFAYAMPVTMTMPVTILILVIFCAVRNQDECAFGGVIPGYLFFSMPVPSLSTFIGVEHAWIWVAWLTSQAWFTMHIWWPRCERLASTEIIFVSPMYSALLIDQSLALNRRIDDKAPEQPKIVPEPKPLIEDDLLDPTWANGESMTPSNLLTDMGMPGSDGVTRIFACATMWHETREEMLEMLKSIFRMDEDQSARRFARTYFSDPKHPDKDYYEFETHIFFDNAFVPVLEVGPKATKVNGYVRDLVNTIDVAASLVHETEVNLRAPKKLPTPYGGQLVWTLPGKTKLIVHLKDEQKIRIKKRWSQVMYMYYLLGYRLMELDISSERKEEIALNTYILALDGDIDFQPAAVSMLVDLMVRDKIHLGAACGRIHPIGTGAMVWYQRFEYAIGHWLQKATEHVIGCVLCSPGCFSLFRAKALMDDSVMRKYTTNSEEARHYVQYDQGEDRWLCTLLLQQGWRVEYSAASDAFTHSPEGFGEFYNQRRRWVPSTMANIIDLLADYKRVVKVNDNISILYIAYQILLLGGSVLGPGTILLMLVGAFNTAFKLDMTTSMILNVVPVIIFMIVCYFAKSETQITVAFIISTVYAMVMIAVLIGIMVQITEDGPLAPSSLFFFIVALQMIVTAMLHPREFGCLPFGVVYYITVPSMYMLLIIYSLFNMNNVSWGTREDPKPVEKVDPNETEEKLLAAAKISKKSGTFATFLNKLRSKPDSPHEDQGSIEFSLGGIFKIMCCAFPKVLEEKQQLARIADTLEVLNRRMESIERSSESQILPRRRSIRTPGGHLGSLPEEEGAHEEFNSEEESDTNSTVPVYSSDEKFTGDDMNWMEDPDLKRSPVDFITGHEETFWRELIDTYLTPINKNEEKEERVKRELKALRDKSVFAFFMLNAMFVMTLFLIQFYKDILHFNWPLGVKNTFETKEGSNDRIEIILTREYLQLDPIGMLFLMSFAFVLVIQFIAMLFHRFGTFSHIMSTTEIDWYCTKKVDVSGEENLNKHAVQFARELQRLRTQDDDDKSQTSSKKGLKRRLTIKDLERSKQKPQQKPSLAAAFERNYLSESAQGESNDAVPKLLRRLTSRRDTLQALATRRSSVIERRKSLRRASMASSIGSEIQRNENSASNSPLQLRSTMSQKNEETPSKQRNASVSSQRDQPSRSNNRISVTFKDGEPETLF